MRVSNYEQFGKSLYNIQLLQSSMSKKMEQISTGKSINRVSDDPIGMNQKMLVEQSYNRIEQFQRNLNDAKSFVELSESTINSVQNVMMESKDIAVKAANGTYSQSDLDTFVKTIEQNIQQLVGLGNTKQMGKYIYAGENTQTKPFDYDGTTLTYNGDSTETKFQVSTAIDMTVLDPGNKSLEGAINSLIDLRNQVQSGNKTNIENSIQNYDNAFDTVVNFRSELGTRLNSIDALNNIYETSKVNLSSQKEQIEGIDLTKTIMDFQNIQRSYQGSLQASAKVMSLSIMNYL